MSENQNSNGVTVDRAFGAENRRRLIRKWFDVHDYDALAPADAWKVVYRLLLWVNPTIGLAHCYENDKCQPGRPWYARSIAFHIWVSEALDVRPLDLGDKIDWMFRRAVQDLAAAKRAKLLEAAREEQSAFFEYDLPTPGEDPELAEIVEEELSDYLQEPPPDEVWSRVVTRIQSHMKEENKRRNLTGEGFEDVVAELIKRLSKASGRLTARTRARLGGIRGFYATREGEKPKVVDLVVEGEASRWRTLVTAKWSVRSDREEQFKSDFESYARLQSTGEGFGHVLITNEFDPARLVRACESRISNSLLFTDVVHVNPLGVLAAYSPGRSHKTRRKVEKYVEEERLIGLGKWLENLLDREEKAIS